MSFSDKLEYITIINTYTMCIIENALSVSCTIHKKTYILVTCFFVLASTKSTHSMTKYPKTRL